LQIYDFSTRSSFEKLICLSVFAFSRNLENYPDIRELLTSTSPVLSLTKTTPAPSKGLLPQQPMAQVSLIYLQLEQGTKRRPGFCTIIGSLRSPLEKNRHTPYLFPQINLYLTQHFWRKVAKKIKMMYFVHLTR